jgi:hypothetical protein
MCDPSTAVNQQAIKFGGQSKSEIKAYGSGDESGANAK